MAEPTEDDELRARLEVLREELEAGKLHFAEGMTVVDSLKAVRYGPDGKVDLSTVDGSVRSLANVTTIFNKGAKQQKPFHLQTCNRITSPTSKETSVGFTQR